VGFPVFDRLGGMHRSSVLYAGTQGLVFDVANLLMANTGAPAQADFADALPHGAFIKDTTHACTKAAAH
jgi:hypothetical protein